MSKVNQCQAFTLKKSQCRNRCVESFCKIHDPKEREKREKIRHLYKEIEERNNRYIKYVERECKKARIRHRRWIERLEKQKKYTNVQCKALTKKELPCKIATKTDYCHVHKHLDTNSVEIEKEEQSISEDDLTISFKEELQGKCRELKLRSYNGPELDPDNMEKINGIYLNELKRKLGFYGRPINNIVDYPDIKLDINAINNIKEDIEESIASLHVKTDEAVNSIINQSRKRSKRTKKYVESPSYYDMASFIKEIENEFHKVELRSYNGPELDPYNTEKVNRAYISEKQNKDEMYIGILRMLSFYSDFDEIDPVDVKKDMKASLKILAKKTDETVKSFVDASKRANQRSKY